MEVTARSLHAAVAVTEPSQVGQARRTANWLSERAGLGETDRGRAALVATELATNLHRHARDGQLCFRTSNGTAGIGLEMLAIDRGPGMPDLARCMVDGYSTGGSPGTGFGAMRRIADELDVHSRQPTGTVVVARVFARRDDTLGRLAAGVQWAAVCVPAPGESVCGDAWAVAERPGRVMFLVADGLGHGVPAAEASTRAAEVLVGDGGETPGRLLEIAHERLR
ncbi:MAG: ATP-binding SpoIIE family protein phosphatase, partial [Planctomycetota bacterium]